MDNAKPNERPLPAEGTWWSRRLEEPGALPGTGLADKEAAWDKLYDRLRETPRRRTQPWLWAAAACLLLALIPAAFILKERRVISGSRDPKIAIRPKALINPARTYPAPAPAHHSPLTAHGSPLKAHRSRLTAPSLQAAPFPAHRSPLVARRSQLVAHRLQLVACSLQPAAPPAHNSPLTARSSWLVAHRLQLVACSLQPAAPPAPSSPLTTPGSPLAARSSQLMAHSYKKQPRVVHINELEPAMPTPSTAGERLKPGRLQVRLTQSETFRPATTYNNDPIDHPIIPLKHTQNP
ncbi:hypothetical protein R1T14_24495 [Flavitalea sp. BT771]|uniref:hypothetical protein n=1 Tax=Flavitalea sp. BT771 TaxID=3063329 RepID=UPI00294A15C8|nr:hypothetical protein [Flavitalea sp. BT771]MDV6222692.1 hypothetical protein [Flavitalea sp. BT771]